MSRQRHSQIRAIGNPRTTDRNVHSRGVRGRLAYRHVRGAAAGTVIPVTGMDETDELVDVIQTGTTAPTAAGGSAIIRRTNFGIQLGRSIASVTIDNGGSGYAGVSGNIEVVPGEERGGTGFAATTTIASGVITAVTVTNAGSGYTAPPELSNDEDPSGGGTDYASFTAVLSALGIVSAVTSSSNRLLVVTRKDPA